MEAQAEIMEAKVVAQAESIFNIVIKLEAVVIIYRKI